jgi:hypothetical protein
VKQAGNDVLEFARSAAYCAPDLVQASRRLPSFRAASPRALIWLRRMTLHEQTPYDSALAMPPCIDHHKSMHVATNATCLPQTVGPRHCRLLRGTNRSSSYFTRSQDTQTTISAAKLGLSVAVRTSWSKRNVMQEVLLIVYDRVAMWGDLHTLRQRVVVEVRR